MSTHSTLRAARRLTVYCPVTPHTRAAVAAGDLAPLTEDPGTRQILALIAASAELGNFGHYRGVCEVSASVEAFTPAAGARPTVGQSGERTLCANVTIITYVPAEVPEARLVALVEALARLHPWEVPVIEVTDVRLYRPDAPNAV